MTTPDESTASPSSRRSLVIPVAVVAALVGAAVCYGLAVPVRLGQDVSVLAVGLIVGGAVRLIAKGATRQEAVVVAILALCGALVGFVWGDYFLWKPFMPEETLRRVLSLWGIVIFAGTTYLAYILALRR